VLTALKRKLVQTHFERKFENLFFQPNHSAQNTCTVLVRRTRNVATQAFPSSIARTKDAATVGYYSVARSVMHVIEFFDVRLTSFEIALLVLEVSV
jgi:hypothetical protein